MTYVLYYLSMSPNQHVVNIVLYVFLSIITCFLFYFYWQYKHCLAINAMYKEDRYSFLKYFIFSILTCGLFHIYFQYKKSDDLYKDFKIGNETDGLIAVLLCVLGVPFIADAILQGHINKYFESK